MSTPFLVKDIFPGSSTSFLRYLTAVDNTLFFRANNSVNGDELWKSDGTAAGTVLVKDIRPAGSSGSTPEGLTAMGNTLFFSANDGVNGFELWKSDGTAAGTVLVKNIFPGNNPSFSSSPRNLRVVGNTLFFSANDGANGYELWKSDGTAAGTVLVKDIRPGSPTSSSDSDPRNLTVVGNTLFFSANDGVNFRKLWKSDGTGVGTVLVSASDGSYPNALTAVGNTLFFSANGGGGIGYELWKTDGTAAGTVLVKNIHPGFGGSFPGGLTAVDNTLYFTANDSVNGYELWKSDGSSAGTVLVADIRPGVPSSAPRNLRVASNTLYFTADDGVNGRELWKSDGTAAGTVLVANIRSGASGSVSSSDPFNLMVVGNTLYFSANDGVNGYELWKSDGTAAGTVLVADIRPGASGSNPRNLRAVGSVLFFSADDGVNGEELWALNLDIPAISIAASNANQTEGNSGRKAFTFTITRTVNTTGINNVDWAVTNAETNSADAADFVRGILPSGVVSFAPGETSKVITINVQGDTAIELDETFTVILSNPTNGSTIITATAQGTIQNDDTSSGGTFTGTTGNDTLTGTTGADTLIGLAGNDIYTVNNSEDVVIENLNEGADNVKSSIDYTLPNNVENLVLTGSANLNGTGNSLNNKIIGNAGNNTLTGLDGNDTLYGKAGADTMVGGLGNDTYIVDNIGDVVVENPNEGIDTVKSFINYTLGVNVENLTLNGTVNLNGTGNALNNKITGNSGANILNGGAGADTLAGKAGNDTFVFRFGESTVTVLDRITDFAIGADKIDLLTQGGAATGAPSAFTRAADSATTNINTIVTNVFADADGATADNQALGLNSAALVRANTSTYLIINDGIAGFQSSNDLVINLTGITGTLPAFGAIPVGNVFV